VLRIASARAALVGQALQLARVVQVHREPAQHGQRERLAPEPLLLLRAHVRFDCVRVFLAGVGVGAFNLPSHELSLSRCGKAAVEQRTEADSPFAELFKYHRLCRYDVLRRENGRRTIGRDACVGMFDRDAVRFVRPSLG
jgi:hypothetical protein